RDDDLTAIGRRNQRLAPEGVARVVHAQIDGRAQQLDGLRAIEMPQQVAVMGQQDAHQPKSVSNDVAARVPQLHNLLPAFESYWRSEASLSTACCLRSRKRR